VRTSSSSPRSADLAFDHLGALALEPPLDLDGSVCASQVLPVPPKHKNLSAPWRTGQRPGKKVRRRP
jgi:hypothetical protein